MLKELTIVLDLGKFQGKAMATTTGNDFAEFALRSKCDVVKDNVDVDNKETFEVALNGQAYRIGQNATHESDKDSKIDIVHKLSAYALICKCSEILGLHTEFKVNIVLAVPHFMLKKDDQKNAYKNYIYDSGCIAFKYKGKGYKLHINPNIFIKNEGFGSIALYPQLFKDKSTAIIDLGGLNMNFAIYKNGELITDTTKRFSTGHGGRLLSTYIENALFEHYNGNEIDYDTCLDALNNRVVQVNETNDMSSIEPIQQAINLYIDDILAIINKRRINLSLLGVVFIGGTSEKIAKELKEKIPHAVVLGHNTTVEGLFQVAKYVFLKA